ncbi:hypothetical protein PM082_006969 [Marasmius tenuissimus]|nr:hypothetical protein PM082_006969 [Marasmius tenuissimus]
MRLNEGWSSPAGLRSLNLSRFEHCATRLLAFRHDRDPNNYHYQSPPVCAQASEDSLKKGQQQSEISPGENRPVIRGRNVLDERRTFWQSPHRIMNAVIALAVFLFHAASSIALNPFSIPYVVVQTLMQVCYIAYLIVIAHTGSLSASADRPPFLALIGVGMGTVVQLISFWSGWFMTDPDRCYASNLTELLLLMAIEFATLVLFTVLSIICQLCLIYAINGKYLVRGSEWLVGTLEKRIFSTALWTNLVGCISGRNLSRCPAAGSQMASHSKVTDSPALGLDKSRTRFLPEP